MNVIEAVSEIVKDSSKVFVAREGSGHETIVYADLSLQVVTEHGVEVIEYIHETVMMAANYTDDQLLVINEATMKLDFVEVEVTDERYQQYFAPCEEVLRLQA